MIKLICLDLLVCLAHLCRNVLDRSLHPDHCGCGRLSLLFMNVVGMQMSRPFVAFSVPKQPVQAANCSELGSVRVELAV
jgi:hypothetical protein